MQYGSEDEAGIPLLIDMIIHFIGGMAATAVMLAAPLFTLGIPNYIVLAANIAGGLAICTLVTLQSLRRHKEHP